jgi:hypothetical protein
MPCALLLAGAALAAAPPPEAPASATTPLRLERPVVLLGEVHDHPQQHALRAEAFAALLATGARPALVMEQFDRERQGDIERARAERPGDAQHLIERASTPAVRTGIAGSRGGQDVM